MEGMSPLMIATKNNYFEIVEMLLKIKNIDMNLKDKVIFFLIVLYYILYN